MKKMGIETQRFWITRTKTACKQKTICNQQLAISIEKKRHKSIEQTKREKKIKKQLKNQSKNRQYVEIFSQSLCNQKSWANGLHRQKQEQNENPNEPVLMVLREQVR